MKAILLAIATLSLSLSVFANNTEERKYRSYGSIQFERNFISCGIQNNYHDQNGVIEKITFDLICEDYYRGRYNELVTYRCGEDFDNCTIEAGDYEIFDGPSYRICDRVVAARCPFTYTLEDIEDPSEP